MFFLLVIAVLVAMYGYIGWRLIVPAAFSLSVNFMLWAVIVLLLVAPFVPTILRFRGHGGFWIDTFAWIGYFIFGFCTLLFAILIFKDVLYLLTLTGQKIIHLVTNSGQKLLMEICMIVVSQFNRPQMGDILLLDIQDGIGVLAVILMFG